MITVAAPRLLNQPHSFKSFDVPTSYNHHLEQGGNEYLGFNSLCQLLTHSARGARINYRFGAFHIFIMDFQPCLFCNGDSPYPHSEARLEAGF